MVAGCSAPTAATPYPGACATLEPVEWDPAGRSTGVPTDVVIRVRFDDYPDPDTVRSDSLLLTTGFFWVPAVYSVDLVAKTAMLRPWQQLSANLGYAIHLTSTLRSLQGCAAPDTIREFQAGTGPAGLPSAPVPAFADVQALFDRRCGGSSCHLDPGPPAGCVAQPAAGLSLCAGQAWDALSGICLLYTSDAADE